MTNMPQSPEFWQFGVVLVAVCVPFFVLIGSLNSNRGMLFWQHRVEYLYAKLVKIFGFFGRHFAKKKKADEDCEKCDDDAASTSTGRPRLRRTNDSQMENFLPGSEGAHRRRDEQSPVQDGAEPVHIKRASSSMLATMLMKGERKKSTTLTSPV